MPIPWHGERDDGEKRYLKNERCLLTLKKDDYYLMCEVARDHCVIFGREGEGGSWGRILVNC